VKAAAASGAGRRPDTRRRLGYTVSVQTIPELWLTRFGEQDAAFVERLGASAFREFSLAPGRSALWMAEHHVALVARRGELRVGFGVVRVRDPRDEPEVLAIAVRESVRGRGVGRRLLSGMEAVARSRGAVALRAHTADFNLAALQLFSRNGYRIAARHPAYYRERFDACELVKHLSPRASEPRAGARNGSPTRR